MLEEIKRKALLVSPSKEELANNGKNAETLRKLSEDKDPDVRCSVVRNPNCPLNLLEKLSEDSDCDVRLAAQFWQHKFLEK